MIMKGCVQWNLVDKLERFLPHVGLEPGTARSVDQS